MLKDLEVSETVAINVPIPKVWDALTNPSIIKKYLYGTETITDWKVGSKIIFQGEYENTHYQDKGIILENIFHEKISYSYWSGFSGLEDKPENYSTVTYLLKPNGNSTTFTWIQKGFVDENRYNHSKNGMKDFLQQMKEIIEKEI